jgi:hypothetical protein
MYKEIREIQEIGSNIENATLILNPQHRMSVVSFLVEYKGKEYDVHVTYDPGAFLSVVKELIRIKLKTTQSAFKDVVIYDDLLTLYASEQDFKERKNSIKSRKMPNGVEFWATLNDPKDDRNIDVDVIMGEKVSKKTLSSVDALVSCSVLTFSTID